MRGLLFSSLFVCLIAATPAFAVTDVSAAKKNAEAAKPAAPVDTRPRMKRDDTPAAAAATPAAAPAAQKQRRTARKPAGAAEQPVAAPQPKAGSRDVAACGQVRQPDLAIEGCGRIVEDLKQKPKARAAAFYNRGNAYLAKGEHDKAIADFDETLKLDPKNASAYNNRGNARNEKGDAAAAVADFNEAVKHNTRYASAYFNRANVRAASGETDAAIKDYDTAIKYNRRNVNAYIARGALHLAAGATAKARTDMKQAAAMERRNAYAVLWHDIAERRAKQKGVLAKAGAKGLDMKAWPAPLVRLYAGELKQDAVLAEADNTSPTTKEAHVCEANFYGGEYALIQGNRDDAVKLFRLAAKDCPRGFLEGIAASAELKGLGEKVGSN